MNRLSWLGGILAVFLVAIAAPASAQQGTARFDHSKTGFALTGAHMTVECVTCHINGRLQGTPRMCVACHNGTVASGKPANHVPSMMPCDTCHRNAVTFANAPMNHVGITSNCQSCHVGQSFYGVAPITMTANHIPTNNADCVTCHRSFMSFAGAAYSHPASSAGQCYSCHGTGTNGALVASASHVPTGAVSCDACHKSTAVGGFSTFAMGTAGHTAMGVGVTSDCTVCHSGTYFGVVGKSATHTPTTDNCSTCHGNFTSFGTASYNHPAGSAGQCYTCHGTGANGAMKEVSNHVPTGSTSCDACHTSTATGGFATYTMGTAGHTALGVSMTTDCTSCHQTNSYFAVTLKPSAHMATTPATQNCSDSGCHNSFTSFTGATYNHPGSSAGQCYTCHGSGSGGAMKEIANHVPTGAVSCDACHASKTTGGFASATMGSIGHSALGITTGSDCTSCHQSATYYGVMSKPSNHVATTPANQNCSASGCHTGFTTFSGATYTHTAGNSGKCYTCHGTGTGGAMVEVSNHAPTGTVSCDACHTSTAPGGFATYTMGSSGHSAVGVTISSDCTRCHTGSYFGVVQKPTAHVTTTANQNCSSSGCHSSFTSFTGAVYNHSGVASGACYSCHSSGQNGAMREVSNHVPTGSTSCDACHTSKSTGGFSTFTMGTSGHTAIGVSTSTNCTTCHQTSSYFGVVVKPSNHSTTTPANQNCYDCHKTFTSFSGASYSHPSSASGNCYSCHGSGAGGAMKEVSNHVPTGTVSCDVCHKSTTSGGFAAYTMGNAGHSALNVVLKTSNCMTCHSGSYFGTKTFRAHGKGNLCGTCHKSFTQDPGGD